MSTLVTAVIGAGPAGLLFTVAGRLLHDRRADPQRWRIRLFDKRASYARAHRLRIDPVPYRDLREDLADKRFDALVAFLEREHYTPAVNALEDHLDRLLTELGVQREVLAIGRGDGEVDLAGLRARLVADGTLASDGRWTIVGADSVHSTIRALAAPGEQPRAHTHQQVARLRVTGPGLPERLSIVSQYRLSKALSSILDYRKNPNGYGEVDLFLTPAEHAEVASIGAKPAEPVVVTASDLRRLRAPLFRSIVEQLEHGFGAGPCEVTVHSAFRLEHAVMPARVFERPDLQARVFLVGDAAVSLPFFRGMACLASSAHALAHAHVDLALRPEEPPPDEGADMRRWFAGPYRPMRFGSHLLPGAITDVQPTVHRGQRAYVVLHRWVGAYGVHVVRRDPNGAWQSLHRNAPVGRRAALADFADQTDPGRRYDREVSAIVRRELVVVAARARLIRGLREFFRVSALLPFPLQSWFLTVPDHDTAPDAPSAGFVLNAIVALAAAAATLAGTHSGLAFALALGLEAAGGIAFRAATTFEAGTHRFVRGVWQAQFLLFFAIAFGAGLGASGLGMLPRLALVTAWAWLAVAFVVGIYVFEGIGRRGFEQGRLDL